MISLLLSSNASCRCSLTSPLALLAGAFGWFAVLVVLLSLPSRMWIPRSGGVEDSLNGCIVLLVNAAYQEFFACKTFRLVYNSDINGSVKYDVFLRLSGVLAVVDRSQTKLSRDVLSRFNIVDTEIWNAKQSSLFIEGITVSNRIDLLIRGSEIQNFNHFCKQSKYLNGIVATVRGNSIWRDSFFLSSSTHTFRV